MAIVFDDFFLFYMHFFCSSCAVSPSSLISLLDSHFDRSLPFLRLSFAFICSFVNLLFSLLLFLLHLAFFFLYHLFRFLLPISVSVSVIFFHCAIPLCCLLPICPSFSLVLPFSTLLRLLFLSLDDDNIVLFFQLAPPVVFVTVCFLLFVLFHFVSSPSPSTNVKSRINEGRGMRRDKCSRTSRAKIWKGESKKKERNSEEGEGRR